MFVSAETLEGKMALSSSIHQWTSRKMLGVIWEATGADICPAFDAALLMPLTRIGARGSAPYQDCVLS